MWVLIILFYLQPGSTALETFETKQACVTMRDLVRVEMMKAYPDDHDDFAIECVFKEKET